MCYHLIVWLFFDQMDQSWVGELLGAFSIGHYTMFDSGYHSFQSLLRFSPKYVPDKFGRPKYRQKVINGDNFLRSTCMSPRPESNNVDGGTMKITITTDNLFFWIPMEICDLQWYFMDLGMTKLFVSRICDSISDTGLGNGNVASFVSRISLQILFIVLFQIVLMFYQVDAAPAPRMPADYWRCSPIVPIVFCDVGTRVVWTQTGHLKWILFRPVSTIRHGCAIQFDSAST